MSRRFYTLFLALLLPYALLHLFWRSLRQPDYRSHLAERFGRYPALPPSPSAGKSLIWLHAVSVGETRAAQPLVEALLRRDPDCRILLTHTTPTGRDTSQQLFGDRVLRAYLPYDFPFAVRRFLRHFRPAVGVLLETEIWPNLVAACRAGRVPLLLANARLSEKSARRYARFPGLAREALAGLAGITAQTAEDAGRLRRLGAAAPGISGNLKFDVAPPPAQFALGQTLRGRIGARPVLVAASTREGEEELLFRALAQRPLAPALLLLVPRHPQRFDAVAALAAAHGLRLQRRSEDAAVRPDTDVLLGDSMGEMFAYYAAGDVAFVGGSLVDCGGQNLIEACAVGVPVLIGPSTFNFAAAADAAVACGAARRIGRAEELLEVAAGLLRDGPVRAAMATAGRAFAARHRGATAKTLEAICRAMR